jgi:glyoxylase I family protein
MRVDGANLEVDKKWKSRYLHAMPNRNTTIGGGGFHHVAIRAYDWDKSVKFYMEALGFQEKIRWGEGPERAIMLDTGDGNYLEIFASGSGEPKPEGCIIHFALRTDECDAAVERARAAGAVITTEPKDFIIQSKPEPTPVRYAFCKGPDGEMIEFFKTPRPERRQLLRILRHSGRDWFA